MPEGNGLNLIFDSIELEDKGNYTCVISERDNEHSKNFTLHVFKPISFTDTPPTQVMTEGDSDYMRCKVEGDPLPTIQWRGKQPNTISSTRHFNSEKGFLINNVSREDAGIYVCAAIQQDYRVTDFVEKKIKLVVRYKPEWKKPFAEKVSSYISWISNLTCEAEGEPIPEISWFRNNDPLTVESGGTYKIFTLHGKSILQVEIINETDFGVYECEAKNAMGSIVRKIHLKKGAGVSAPNVIVKESQPNSIELGIIMAKGDVKVSNFVVKYKMEPESWDDAHTEEFGLGGPYIIRDLQYNTQYVLRVAAKTSAGMGEYTSDILQMTQELKDKGSFENDATEMNRCKIGMWFLIPIISLIL